MSGVWRRHRVLWLFTAVVLLMAAGCAILLMPTTTRQGVNYKVTAYRIPAYVKTIDFLQRHYQYEVLVSRICAGSRSPDECVMAIFDWTYRSIVPSPPGLPIVDDHPLHIVIRGYGASDQMADVFVTLAVYSGVPAFLKFVTEPGHGKHLVLSFVQLDGKWAVFDVANHVVFRTRSGAFASVEEVVADPALADAHPRQRADDPPYSAFISRELLLPFVVPRPLRSELQQPWPRLRYEVRRAVGWERPQALP